MVCRGWDFAATEKKLKGDDPDYTAGVKIVKVGVTYYITDCIAERKNAADVDSIVMDTAKNDALHARIENRRYFIRLPVDPGSAGKSDNYRKVTMLNGYDAAGRIPTGDKLTRAAALAAQAMVGNVKLLRGAWNETWLTHMHHQPDYDHDDIMDASAEAFNGILEMEEETGINYSTRQYGYRP